MALGALGALGHLVAVTAARPVDRYAATWSGSYEVPSDSGFGSPYTGNGDIGAVYHAEYRPKTAGGNVEGRDKGWNTGKQLFGLGKNDFWISEGKTYFYHVSGPTMSFALREASGNVADMNFTANVTQDPGNATVTSFQVSVDNATTLRSQTVVGEGGTNAVLTSLVCSRADDAVCEFEIALRDCCGNSRQLGEAAGGDASSIWFRKENLHDGHATNGAETGSCNPDDLYYNMQRTFAVAPGTNVFTMTNGSCPWVLVPGNVTESPITTGSCDEAQGRWVFNQTAGPAVGKVVWQGGNASDGSALCLASSARLGACSTASAWTLNTTAGPSYGFLSTPGRNSPTCLMVVPDNSNNTLAAAAMVVETATGTLVRPSAPGAALNASNPSDGSRMIVALKSGVSYTIITAVQTLRDLGCAGTRGGTETCTRSVQAAATAHAASLTKQGALAAALAARESFWARYWDASEVDITQGSPNATANATQIEKWYYGMQYSFGTNSRQGKVAPSLNGIFANHDPLQWNDQLTIDYNFESNYWGAGSSNRLEYMLPYVATVTSPPVLETMRQRATTAGVWNNAPSVHWPGTVGGVVGSTSCPPTGQCAMQQNLGHEGGYRGAAWPSTMFPLGDGRPAPTDLATRFIGGLVATPLIQYYEYSRDIDALRDFVYPVVRDNAEFYASYALNADAADNSTLLFPYTCAQEACACRNNLGWYWRWGKFVGIPLPNMTAETAAYLARSNTSGGPSGVWDTSNGEHDAHADLAFASASFRKAAEYARLLGVDAGPREIWLALLARMPAYPTQTLTWVRNDSAVIVGAELSGKAMLVEAKAGATPSQAAAWAQGQYVPGTKGNCTEPPCSTIVWPWCNADYPITNFAGMWPTDEIGSLQTTDPALLAAAKATVYGINEYTGYAFKGSRTPFSNANGFGLSWPPTVRVSNASDGALLMAKFAGAARQATAKNGIIANNGGMLENAGAVVAVNDMLFQSHAGALRFFPVWDAAAHGAASFRTLRGYGAFLASGSIGGDGVVAPVTLLSEKGSDCVVESPWPTLAVTSAGKPVPTAKVGALFSFPTTAGGTYTLSQQ